MYKFKKINTPKEGIKFKITKKLEQTRNSETQKNMTHEGSK